MNKKAVSPLIAYILLIGMVVAMSAIVGNFLIKQSRSINFESKEIEIYCSDVAIDGYPVCLAGTSGIGINITNRGYYNVSDFSIVKRENNVVTTLTLKDNSYSFSTYLPIPNNGQLNPITQAQLSPESKGLLKVVINQKNLIDTEILITPILKINDKIASCNEKVFKLSNIQLPTGPCLV
jgi:hypothetical protein